LLFAVMVLLVGGLAAFYFAFVRSTPEENRRQAEIYFANGEYNRAVQYIGKAVHKRSDDVDLIYRFVEMLWLAEVDTAADAGDRLKQIIDLHRRAVEARSRDEQVLERLYRLLYDLSTKQGMGGFYMGWLGDLTQVKLSSVSEGPIADVARRYRGIALAAQLARDSSAQNRQTAFDDLQHALEVDPDDHLAAHSLARWSLIEADRLQQLRTSADKLEELRESAYELSRQTLADPEAPHRLERLALHAELLGDNKLAAHAQERAAILGELEEHLREHGEPRWLFIETARQLYNAQRTALAAELTGTGDMSLIRRAIALLQRASEAFPEDATLHRLRGQLLTIERPDDAIEAFRAAVEIDETGRALEVLRAAQAEDVSRIAIGNLLLAKAQNLESEEAREAIYQQVQQQIEAVEQSNAGNPATTLLLGRLQLARGENDLALATLDRASKQYNHTNIEALQLLAAASQRLGQWGNTQRQLERLIALVPNSPRHRLALAEAQLRSKNFEAAQESFEKAKALAPDHPGLPLLEARLAAAFGDFERAIALLEDLDEDQRDIAADLLIELYRRTGQEDAARSLAMEQFENDPTDVNKLRLALRAVDDVESRAALLERAESQGAPSAAIDLLREQLIEGRNPDMEEITTRAVAEIENPADRRVAEGRIALAKGSLEQAREAAEEVLESSPDHAGAIDLAFRVALDQRDFSAAEAMAQRAGKLNLDYAEGRFYDGRIAAAREQWGKAAVAFERGLNLRPVYSRGWAVLGQARVKTGDYAAAATAFERAIEQKPDNVEARLALAQAYDRLFEPDRATQTLEQARRFAPGDAQIFRSLADYYATQGRLDDAIALRRNWAQRRPGDIANRRAMAALLAASQRGEEALRVVQAIIDEQGMNRSLAVLLAQVHRRSGEPERGLETLTAYVTGLGPDADPDDHLALARYLADIGRVDQAVERFRLAAELAEAQRPGDTAVLRQLGDTLFNAGRFSQAAEVYRRIHAAEPEDDATRLRLAETLVRLNRGEEAGELLGEIPQKGTSLVLLAMRMR
jgi:predicted Zn-dependent protease